MACVVLTPERWQKFLEDDLAPEEAEALRVHLQTECAACEDFLIGLGPDKVDQALWRLWDALTEGEEIPPTMTESESARLYRKISAALASPPEKTAPFDPTRKKEQAPFFSFPPAWILSGAVAMMILGLFLVKETRVSDLFSPPYDGVKGRPAASAPLALHLEFSVQKEGGAIERGEMGGRYPSSGLLFFRATTSEKGYLTLFEIDAKGAAILLYPNPNSAAPPMEKGTHDLEQEGAPLGLPLQGARGRLTVAGVLSRAPLDFTRKVLPEIEKNLRLSEGKPTLAALFPNDPDRASDIVTVEVAEK